jgi:hypothetical protein
MISEPVFFLIRFLLSTVISSGNEKSCLNRPVAHFAIEQDT